MTTKSIGYWATTALLAFAMVSGGVAELAPGMIFLATTVIAAMTADAKALKKT